MPLTVFQMSTVSGRDNGGGGGGGGRGGGGVPGGGGGIGGGGGLPPGVGGGGGLPGAGGGSGPRPTMNLPTANLPTARPTFSQPINQPTFSMSFTRSIATSFTFNPTMTSWTGISFTRTVVTSYTFNPTFTFATTTAYPTYGGGGGYYGGWTFIQYPPNYNSNVGSFTLDQTLTGQNDAPCAYYTYFGFNANAGQQFQARLWTQGATINYVIVPQSVFNYLQQMGCGYGSAERSQVQSFNSQITLNWTAPQTGQYVVVFYSLTPYGGPVYFLPGAQ